MNPTQAHPRSDVLPWLMVVALLAAPVRAAEALLEQESPAPVAAASAQPPPPEAGSESAAADPAPTAVPLEQALGDRADPLDGLERQIEAREYDASIAGLEDYMAGIEAQSHRFDQRLVRPLTLLGDAYAGQGRFADALEKYQRALHLSRVNAGLNTPDQVEIVYREANVLKALGDYQEANDREEYAYHVLSRAHGPMDEALLPGLYHLAEWYERTSNVFAARGLYEQAVVIIDANDKLGTPAAIPALRGIATSYRMERFPPFYMSQLETSESSVVAGNGFRHSVTVNNFPAGEAALQRIIQIRQNQQPLDRIALAKSVLDLADWYTLFDKSGRAEPLYAHAWELMSQVESFDVASYFADPELLYFPAPGNPAPPPVEERGERSTGYVEVAFSVTDDGYVRALDTVASEPDGLMDFKVRKSLRLSRYRPMLVDGVPVERESFTYRHEFPYYPERQADDPADMAAAAPGG